MHTLFFLVVAVAAGCCIPVQAGINAQLSEWTRHPALAALISFAVGTVGLLAYAAALRIPWPALATVGQTQWWHWVGGFLGAFLVAMSIYLVPKLGAATMIAGIVAGQMLCSLVLDHFGWVGYDVRPAGLMRLLGALLLVAGVVLIRKY
jgi:transporter family-2 protein